MEKTVKKFKCRDIGVDCGWNCQADSEVELMRLIQQHAHRQHGIQNVNEDLERKIRNAIRDERAVA
jgi:predicted small metal-binding protein